MVDEKYNNARDRLFHVRAQIDEAKQKAGRENEKVSLVCVSKFFSADQIRPVIDAGQRIFGENRVQEAAEKWPEMQKEFKDIELHLIGPLQTNKSVQAVKLFDYIETLDRPKLARELAKAFDKTGKAPKLFIQVNTGAEHQKAGVLPTQADEFIQTCRSEYQFEISGLMCIPPVDEEASLHFSLLAKIAERNGIQSLSMGMSGDFAKAIRFGATHVRIGTAIFGQR